MKKLLSLALAAVLCASLWGCSTKPVVESNIPKNTGSVSPSPMVEEVSYEVTYANARTYTNSIGTTWLQTIIEIENTGSSDLYLSAGSYDLEDSAGKLIASRSTVSAYPDVISTGEKGYMYEETTLDNPVEGALTVIPRISADKAKVDNIRYSVTDVEISNDTYGGVKALGRIENTFSEDSSGLVYITLIMKNSDGKPIGLMFTILSEVLKAGDKIGFEMSGFSLPDDITADSVAGYEVFAYPLQMQF